MLGYGGGMMGGVMHAGGFGMMLHPILLIVILGLTVYLLVRTLNKKNRADDQSLNILRERFARGEIDEVEYITRSKILKEK